MCLVSLPSESPRPGVSRTKIFSRSSLPNHVVQVPLVSKVSEVSLSEGLNISLDVAPVMVLHVELLPVPVLPRTHNDLIYS